MNTANVAVAHFLVALGICAGCSRAAVRYTYDPANGSRAIIAVSAFGAKCDGNADDTKSLRAAAMAYIPSGKTLKLPHGVCVIHGTIYLGSHTHVIGDGTTVLASLPWDDDQQQRYALVENVHWQARSIVDTDISVKNLTLDYGNVAQLKTPQGGKHALRFEFVRDAVIEGNTFQVRGAEDAVAGLGVESMLVKGNHAYDFRNCAYDFWYGPSDVKVLDNYAETETSAQVINFNPERTAGDSNGMVARGLVMSGNTLIVTGHNAAPIQLEPLGPDTRVQDLSVTTNSLQNVYLVLRGNVRNADIRSNVISDVMGGASAIETYTHYGMTADSISVVDNEVDDAATISSELGVIRIEATRPTARGNVISGTGHQAPNLYRGSFATQ